MAVVWSESESSPSVWEHLPLAGNVYALRGSPPMPVAVPSGQPQSLSEPQVRRCTLSGQEAWILLVPPAMSIFINGNAIKTHVRLLHDRDALWWQGISPFYFSMESPLRAAPFKGEGDVIYCARCKRPLEAGQQVVRCSCGIYHHEDVDAKIECWSYSEQCAACERSTRVDALFAWSPDCA